MTAIYIDTQQEPEKVERLIDSLKPVPGTCIFMDMCNSTELKYHDYRKWILMMSNTFNVAENLALVKITDDEFYAKFISRYIDS